MQTFEWMLVYSALLTCLLILSTPIQEHIQQIQKSILTWTEKQHGLDCSIRHEKALTHYARITAQDCFFYPYAIHSPTGPFELYVGMDANHYD